MPEIPEGAKKPSDKKAKASKDQRRTVTIRDVEVTVDLALLDDWAFAEDLAIAQGGDEASLFAAIRTLRRVAGPAYAELRQKAIDEAGGRLTVEAGADALLPLIQEILEAADAPNS